MTAMSREDRQNPICLSIGNREFTHSLCHNDICSTFEIISPCRHLLVSFQLVDGVVLPFQFGY